MVKRENGNERNMTSAKQQLKVLGCPRCNEKMKTALIRFQTRDHNFGIFPGFKCANGHRYLDGDAEEDIKEEAEELGIWEG